MGSLLALLEMRVIPMSSKRIPGRNTPQPYLDRWHLRRRLKGVSVYLHKLWRGDDDPALHSHPWRWAFAIILSGGYLEEIRVGDRVVTRKRGPLSVGLLRHDTYHRIVMPAGSPPSWSLFVTGPRVVGSPCGSWYFWDPITHNRIPESLYREARKAGMDPNHLAEAELDRRE